MWVNRLRFTAEVQERLHFKCFLGVNLYLRLLVIHATGGDFMVM